MSEQIEMPIKYLMEGNTMRLQRKMLMVVVAMLVWLPVVVMAATGTFAATDSMTVARTSNTETLLLDGTVLLTGGLDQV